MKTFLILEIPSTGRSQGAIVSLIALLFAVRVATINSQAGMGMWSLDNWLELAWFERIWDQIISIWSVKPIDEFFR
jgi:hypothetical protein